MLVLSAKIRKDFGKKVKLLRKKGILPAILYGPKINKPLPLGLEEKAFEKIYKEAGESSLITLAIAKGEDEALASSPSDEIKDSEGKPSASYGASEKEKFLVLIHDIEYDPLTGKPIHVDFYQPRLEEEIEVKVPIIFEGEAPAVKELAGTLIKNISEVEVKALPQKLPKEIKVNVENLKTFEDRILIEDLVLPEGVKILKEASEIVASVTPPEKVEEELEKPIEEKVEEVEKVEEKEVEEKEGEEKKEK